MLENYFEFINRKGEVALYDERGVAVLYIVPGEALGEGYVIGSGDASGFPLAGVYAPETERYVTSFLIDQTQVMICDYCRVAVGFAEDRGERFFTMFARYGDSEDVRSHVECPFMLVRVVDEEDFVVVETFDGSEEPAFVYDVEPDDEFSPNSYFLVPRN